MAFFGNSGPGRRPSLSGAEGSPTLYEQILQQLMRDIPALQGLNVPQGKSIQTLGYGSTGPNFGQGQTPFNIPLFESSSPYFSESITGVLQGGGQSGGTSVVTGGAGGTGRGLPSVPAAPSTSMLNFDTGADDTAEVTQTIETETDDGGVNVGQLLDVGKDALSLVTGVQPGGGTTFDPTGQTQTQAYQQQRIGERDLSTLGGSFLNTGLQFPVGGVNQSIQPPPSAPGMSPEDAFRVNAGVPQPPSGSIDLVNQYGTPTTQVQQNIQALVDAGFTPDMIEQVFGRMEPAYIDPTTGDPMVSPTVGEGTSGIKLPNFDLSNLLNGITAASGAFGLYDAVKRFEEDPSAASLQALQSIAQTYSGLRPVVNQVFGTNLPSLTDLGASIVSKFSPQTGNMVKEVFSNSASSGASGWAALNSPGGYANVLGLVLAAASPFIKQDRDNAALMATAQSALNAISIATSTNPYTAAVMAAIAQGMSLYDSIEQGYGAGQTIANMAVAPILSFAGAAGQNIQEHINEAFLPSRDWRHFVPQLMANQAQQDTAFSVLAQALPYVRSKEELGQLLNSYENYLATTTGITPEQWGGSGPGDPYSIAKIPGVGPETHGIETTPIDWGPQTQALQGLVDEYLKVLPGERLPMGLAYGQPGGGLEGEAYRRLWQQFLLTPGDVPSRSVGGGPGRWIFSEDGTPGFVTEPGIQQFAAYTGQDTPYDYYSAQDIALGQGAGTVGLQTAWNPATGEWVYTRGEAPPKPSDYFQQSPYWDQLTQTMFEQSPAGQAAKEWNDYLAAVSQYYKDFPSAFGSELQNVIGSAPVIQGEPTSPDAGGLPLSLQLLLSGNSGGGLTPEQLEALQWYLSQPQPAVTA